MNILVEALTLRENYTNGFHFSDSMSYYGFTLQELRDLMELRGEEALVKERGLTLLSQANQKTDIHYAMGLIYFFTAF